MAGSEVYMTMSLFVTDTVSAVVVGRSHLRPFEAFAYTAGADLVRPLPTGTSVLEARRRVWPTRPTSKQDRCEFSRSVD